ncbi:hypothetical protein CK203_107835 [Vitis vinifera]|uniref:Uncharacterized protein n=1 Tax=Vitis vinifera TaxID=29760 RepID=A0A438CCH4_VITVI|nr:hypothetical protein CK203_107835 [Vitis vinifera]
MVGKAVKLLGLLFGLVVWSEIHWPGMERWLQQRYAEMHPGSENNEKFRILGYQWRVLRFNDETRQSTAKIMAAYRESDPGSVFIMQQANCLAVPYLKSVLSVGLASIASCNYDLMNAVNGKKTMNILCIGHGGGSLPLFLASKIKVCFYLRISGGFCSLPILNPSNGFPHFSVMSPSGERVLSEPDPISEVFWKGVHERLFLFESDAEEFIQNANKIYDMVFVDAYDGDDIFPYKLRDPNSPFLKALKNRLNTEHGTVCRKWKVWVGIHSFSSLVCNTSLAVCRGFRTDGGSLDRDKVLNTLISKSLEVENVMDLPFSCLQYIKRGFILAD